MILADEVYDKVLYDGVKHTAIGSLSEDVLTLTFNWVVANGDNILFAAVQQALAEQHAASQGAANYSTLINTATTAFYSDLYFWVNLLGLLLQAFVAWTRRRAAPRFRRASSRP